MITITCPSCGKTFEHATAAPTLASCADCQATFVPAGARTAPVLTRTQTGEYTPAAQIPLSEEFLRRYRLERLVGTGAMGTVYRAVQVVTSRIVAVKFMLAVASPDGLARFVREGRLQARISHPNVVRAYDIGGLQGHPYFVVEYLAGGSLRQLLQRSGRLEAPEALRIACACLSGLGACHQAGVIHRDLKPDNILFDERGEPKIADLGIAKAQDELESLTETGAVIGTPRYMSPEQLRGEPADARSDIHAIGLIAYEMLSGQPPYAGLTMADLLARKLSSDLPRLETIVPGLPAGLAAVVHRALERKPQDRPGTVAELLVDLSRWNDSDASTTIDTLRADRPRAVRASPEKDAPAPKLRRARSGPALVALLAALSAGILLYGGISSSRARVPAGGTSLHASASASPPGASAGLVAEAPRGGRVVIVDRASRITSLALWPRDGRVHCGYLRGHSEIVLRESRDAGLSWTDSAITTVPGWHIDIASFSETEAGTQLVMMGMQGSGGHFVGGTRMILGFRGRGSARWTWDVSSSRSYRPTALVTGPSGRDLLFAGMFPFYGGPRPASARAIHLVSSQVALTRFCPGAHDLPEALPCGQPLSRVGHLELFRVGDRMGLLSQSFPERGETGDMFWSVQDRPGESALPPFRPIAGASGSSRVRSTRLVMFGRSVILALGQQEGVRLFRSWDGGRTFAPLVGPALLVDGRTPTLTVRGDELFLSCLVKNDKGTTFHMWSTRDGLAWSPRQQLGLPPSTRLSARFMSQILDGDRLVSVAYDDGLGLFALTYP